MKNCKNCGELKILDEFPKDKKLLDGRGSWCKLCSNERSRKNTLNRITLRQSLGVNTGDVTTKFCNLCKTDKDFSEFNKNLKLQHGLEYCCKDCYNNMFRLKYRPKHKEKQKEYKVRYCIKNKDRLKKYSEAYYLKNKKVSNSRGKVWRNENKDHCKIRNSKYRKDNKALCNTHTQARRAKKRNSTHQQHDKIIEKIYQELSLRVKQCIGIDFHVDHILPLNCGGYHHHLNLQVIPGRLNESKCDNLEFKHPLLIHWSELPNYLLDRIKL